MHGEWSRNVGENKNVENQVPISRLCWLPRFIDSKQLQKRQRCCEYRSICDGPKQREQSAAWKKKLRDAIVLVPLASARASLTHISASTLARFVAVPSLKDRSSSSSSSTQHDAFMLLFARCCLVYVILHPSSLCLFHSRCNCCAGEKQVFQPGLLFLSFRVGWDAIRISFLRLPSWSILFCSFITLRVFCENGIRCVFCA